MSESLKPGHRPILIWVFDGKSSFGIHFNRDDGIGNGSLGGWAGARDPSAIMSPRIVGFSKAKPLFEGGPSDAWHHYALVWDKDGLKGIAGRDRKFAIFLDGQLNGGPWGNAGPTSFIPLDA